MRIYDEKSDIVVSFARYICDEKTTIRKVAEHFGYSKSTVHYYLQKKLKQINKKLFYEVKTILENNFNEKHLRGGNSTKIKYSKKIN